MENGSLDVSLAGADSESRADHVVDFAPNDPADPLNWSRAYKWAVILVLSLLSACVQLATVIAAPVAPQIQIDLDDSSATAATLLVTVWELGEVVGPLLYGPLCERTGRLPVLHLANLLCTIFLVACACSTTMSMLIAMRFLAGASAAVISVSGGVVSDLFVKEARRPALSVMMVGSQVGPALGPIMGSYLGEAKGWRWAFWLSAILMGAASTAFAALYRETYRVKVLDKRTASLRRETGNQGLRSVYRQHSDNSWSLVLSRVLRPLYLLSHSWLLAGVTAYVSFFLGLFYLALTSIAPTFQRVYSFTEGQAGLAYLGLFTGMMLGCAYLNLPSRLTRSKNEAKGVEQPLVPSVVAGLIMASGFFIFGWTVQYGKHWIAPILATMLVGIGYFIITASVRLYILNVFGIWAVSASAAMLAVRNLSAAFIPLAGPPLYARLGFGWGSSILGFLGLLFVPIPILFIHFGERLRRGMRLSIQE